MNYYGFGKVVKEIFRTSGIKLGMWHKLDLLFFLFLVMR